MLRILLAHLPNRSALVEIHPILVLIPSRKAGEIQHIDSFNPLRPGDQAPDHDVVIDDDFRSAFVEAMRLTGYGKDPDLDDIASHVALAFSVPIAILSLVDKTTQYVLGASNGRHPTMPRESAFCDVVIRRPNAVVVVGDVLADERFRSHPLAQPPTSLRFAAGVALVMESGFAVGALSIFGLQPRTMSDEQCDQLRHFAQQAVTRLDVLTARTRLE